MTVGSAKKEHGKTRQVPRRLQARNAIAQGFCDRGLYGLCVRLLYCSEQGAN